MSERKSEASTADRKVKRGADSGTGAFAGTQAGGSNEGVSSAKPQVITGHEDASFEGHPDTSEKPAGKDAGKDI